MMMIRCNWYLTCRQGACGDGPCHDGKRPGWLPTGGLVREWGGASLECRWWELWAWLLKDTWYPHKLNVLVIMPYRIPGKWRSIGGGAHLGIQGGHNWRLWESPRRWNRRKWPSGLVDVPYAFICTACRISLSLHLLWMCHIMSEIINRLYYLSILIMLQQFLGPF